MKTAVLKIKETPKTCAECKYIRRTTAGAECRLEDKEIFRWSGGGGGNHKETHKKERAPFCPLEIIETEENK